jgi:hypothetical protein
MEDLVSNCLEMVQIGASSRLKLVGSVLNNVVDELDSLVKDLLLPFLGQTSLELMD